MTRKLIKAGTIVLVFLLALVFFSLVTNQTNADLTANMADATLPTISFYYEDVQLEELHAYVNEMDACAMRDSILPLDEGRMMQMEIHTYGRDIDSIAYQIRSMDASRLVADGSSDNFQVDGQTIPLSFQIQSLLTQGEEYLLILTLESQGQTLYYYSRIMSCGENDLITYIDFAKQFHEETLAADGEDFIPTYMDAASGDNTTLSYVDLGCSLSQIMWGNFEGQVLDDVVVSVKEIMSTYTVLTLQYVMVHTNADGQTEYYNVEEYYRLRMGEERMYVLNFERTMNQIFRGEDNFVYDASNLLLGIRSSDVHYETSEAGDKVAFVQEGDLWCYDNGDHSMVEVFSFRSSEGMDARENWNQHGIKIVRMDEAGSLDFIVYGYMNRGDHEGEVGVGIYHYDALARTVEEEAFIPSQKSYEIVKAELGQLMYEDEQGTIYLMLEGNVYRINTDTLEAEAVISDLEENAYAISASNRYFAWVDEDDLYASTQIHLMDLMTGETRDISDGSGDYLLPLGFYGEDLIYGAAGADLVAVNAAGNLDFPMEYLRIVDAGTLALLKEYSKSGNYIEGIAVNDSSISVYLIKMQGGNYISAGEDAIMDREAESGGVVTIGAVTTDLEESEVVLTLSASISSDKVKLIVPKTVILEEARLLDLQSDAEYTRYYVYAKGQVALATDSITNAISIADGLAGVVVDRQQQYLWMRAHSTTKADISVSVPEPDAQADSIARCVSAMLRCSGVSARVSEQMQGGATPKEILENALSDYQVLDLTGCTIEGLLFYISNDHPVFAMTGAQDAVLIVGYTTDAISCYDPMTGETQSYTYADAEELFGAAGSIFLGYY